MLNRQINNEYMIKWYKIKCSFFEQEFGVKLWRDVIDFMSKNIGFDYEITGQETEPFYGVDAEYKNGNFIKL